MGERPAKATRVEPHRLVFTRTKPKEEIVGTKVLPRGGLRCQNTRTVCGWAGDRKRRRLKRCDLGIGQTAIGRKFRHAGTLRVPLRITIDESERSKVSDGPGAELES